MAIFSGNSYGASFGISSGHYDMLEVEEMSVEALEKELFQAISDKKYNSVNIGVMISIPALLDDLYIESVQNKEEQAFGESHA